MVNLSKRSPYRQWVQVKVSHLRPDMHVVDSGNVEAIITNIDRDKDGAFVIHFDTDKCSWPNPLTMAGDDTLDVEKSQAPPAGIPWGAVQTYRRTSRDL